MKTPEQMAEECADDWHKDCNYPEEILARVKKATATVFLAGYQAGQEHPFQFQAKMWIDPIGPQNQWISVKNRLPESNVAVLASIVETVGDRKINDMEVVTYRSGIWLSVSTYYPEEAVSHWMPLPKPPEDK